MTPISWHVGIFFFFSNVVSICCLCARRTFSTSAIGSHCGRTKQLIKSQIHFYQLQFFLLCPGPANFTCPILRQCRLLFLVLFLCFFPPYVLILKKKKMWRVTALNRQGHAKVFNRNRPCKFARIMSPFWLLKRCLLSKIYLIVKF